MTREEFENLERYTKVDYYGMIYLVFGRNIDKNELILRCPYCVTCWKYIHYTDCEIL